MKLAEAMAETAKTMGQMNKQMDPMKVAQTMSEFEKQNMRMEMTEETSEQCDSTFHKRLSPNESCLVFFSVNDALDDILADSDDESEEQAVITQVLDEIGIEISGKVSEGL